MLDGLLIGAAGGALLGLIPDYYDDCEECHDTLFISVGIGAGLGVLIDALRTKSAAAPSRTAYAFRVDAAVGRRRAGLRATLRWR